MPNYITTRQAGLGTNLKGGENTNVNFTGR